MKQNCLRCTHYLGCKDPAKSIIYVCSRFDTNRTAIEREAAILTDLTEHEVAPSGLFLPKQRDKELVAIDPNTLHGIDASAIIDKILTDKRLVSPDIRVPEDDFAKAPNFYTWCVSDKFLNQKPFVQQALIATKVFAEYCTVCSDIEWMDSAKVNDSLSKFERKVALLEHGVCPYCHRNKLQLYKKYGLKLFIELALNAGQRCVTADTLVLTQDGIVEIGDYVGNRPYGFSDFGKQFHTGDNGFQTASKFYRARAEHCHNLVTYNGFSVCGTKDHPVMTLEGFKRLENVSIIDYVRVYYGQKVFGNKTVILRDVTEKTNLEYDTWRNGLSALNRSNTIKPRRKPGCGKRNIYELNEAVARMLGYWVAEGRHRGIANDDPNVLKDCFNTLHAMFGDVIKLHSRGVSFSNTYVQMWLQNLIGYDIKGKSANKEVPRCILQASKNVQTAFLSALFEGDGSATSRDNKQSVSYGTISKKLADQLSVMLLNIGIPHKRRTKFTWATNGSEKQVSKDCYTLSIRGPVLLVFQDEINFQSDRKKGILAQAVEFVKTRTNLVPHFYEKLPEPMSAKFFALMDKVQSELNQLPNRGTTGSCFGLASIFDNHRQYLRVGRLRTALKSDVLYFAPKLLSGEFALSEAVISDLQEMLDFAKSNYYYERVASNDLTKEKLETYDVTIPGSHRFISNGLLSHNSGKSALLGMMFTYMVHRLIKLERPNEVYGLLSSTVLQATFVALTFAQAKDTLFDGFYGNLLSSPWFREYHSCLDHVERRHGEKELYQLNDTFVHYRHRRLMIYPAGPDKRILRGRTRFGACLAGDTLVSTSKGLIPISTDLEGIRTHVGDNHFKITDWAETGVKQTYRLRLENGLHVDATANHEFKTDSGWKRLDKIVKGDKMLVSLGGHFPKTLPLAYSAEHEPLFADIYREIDRKQTFELADLMGFGRSVTPITSQLRRAGLITRHYYKGRTGADGQCRCYYTASSAFDAERLIAEAKDAQSFTRAHVTFPRHMTAELASLLGYMIADGSYNEDALEFSFATSVLARQKHFMRCFKATFGVKPTITQYETTLGTPMTRYSMGQNIFKEFFRYLGLKPATAETKEIPWSILRAPKHCVAAFLAAAYDCDGGFHKHCIFYETVSPKLAHQMQIVLQRFGILSYAKTLLDTTMREHPVRRVTIRERFYQEVFADTIGFSTNPMRLRTSNARVCNLPDKYSLVRLSITDRKTLGMQKVYDITVDDDDHGFTANGMVAHNSIDELGWFPNDADAKKNVKMNADEVYTALDNSLATVAGAARNLIKRGFFDVPLSYFLNISSPSSIRDKICELVRKAQGSKYTYGVQRATWEMNPTLPFKCSFLRKKFRDNPVDAMRDFGAQPPLTNSPFISNKDAVVACHYKSNKVSITIRYLKLGDGSQELYGDLDSARRVTQPSALAIDAGYSNNSFAFAVGHLKSPGKPVIDCVGEVMPIPGIPVNYTYIYRSLISQLFAFQNIVLMAADRWNSLKILSDAEADFSVRKVQHSLKYLEMQMFKSYLLDGELLIPKTTMPIDEILKYNQGDYPQCFLGRPEDHLALQLLTVQDTGSQVIKGDRLTDDIARASMLCFQQLMDEDNAELFAGPSKETAARVDITQMAVGRQYSGGSSSGNSGFGGSGMSNLGVLRGRA